jgi:FixJ family two-component response regulator
MRGLSREAKFVAELQQRYNSLTSREREVLALEVLALEVLALVVSRRRKLSVIAHPERP